MSVEPSGGEVDALVQKRYCWLEFECLKLASNKLKCWWGELYKSVEGWEDQCWCEILIRLCFWRRWVWWLLNTFVVYRERRRRVRLVGVSDKAADAGRFSGGRSDFRNRIHLLSSESFFEFIERISESHCLDCCLDSNRKMLVKRRTHQNRRYRSRSKIHSKSAWSPNGPDLSGPVLTRAQGDLNAANTQIRKSARKVVFVF